MRVGRSLWIALWVALLCLSSALGVAHAETALEGTTLRERLARLRSDAESIAAVRTAIEQAELALSRAERALAANNAAGAERAMRIAEAATTLAERRSDLARERRLSRVVAERKKHVQEETKRAREALAAQRARTPPGADPAERPE
jgi:hypothetical protein